MLYFRCYKCWAPLEFEKEKGTDYTECPECGTKLYVGKESFRKLAEAVGALINPETHQQILDSLLNDIRKQDNIVEGHVETIAGDELRHEPDAIFYHIDDVDQEFPLIFEVETCKGIDKPHSISQCKLFGQTAVNTEGEFYFVVPEKCLINGKKVSGKTIAKKVLANNDIEYDDIITY